MNSSQGLQNVWPVNAALGQAEEFLSSTSGIDCKCWVGVGRKPTKKIIDAVPRETKVQYVLFSVV